MLLTAAIIRLCYLMHSMYLRHTFYNSRLFGCHVPKRNSVTMIFFFDRQRPTKMNICNYDMEVQM